MTSTRCLPFCSGRALRDRLWKRWLTPSCCRKPAWTETLCEQDDSLREIFVAVRVIDATGCFWRHLLDAAPPSELVLPSGAVRKIRICTNKAKRRYSPVITVIRTYSKFVHFFFVFLFAVIRLFFLVVAMSIYYIFFCCSLSFISLLIYWTKCMFVWNKRIRFMSFEKYTCVHYLPPGVWVVFWFWGLCFEKEPLLLLLPNTWCPLSEL